MRFSNLPLSCTCIATGLIVCKDAVMKSQTSRAFLYKRAIGKPYARLMLGLCQIPCLALYLSNVLARVTMSRPVPFMKYHIWWPQHLITVSASFVHINGFSSIEQGVSTLPCTNAMIVHACQCQLAKLSSYSHFGLSCRIFLSTALMI